MTDIRFERRRFGILRPIAIVIGSWSWMPRLLPWITRFDLWLQRISRGRVTLLDLAGLPNLTLTTVGRKSGVPRTNPLLCVPDGDRILVAGSFFGGPKEPMWVKNIEANPQVTGRFRRRDHALTARRLHGEDRAQAWSTMVRVWPNFDRYEQWTNRTIKVFALTPSRDAEDTRRGS